MTIQQPYCLLLACMLLPCSASAQAVTEISLPFDAEKHAFSAESKSTAFDAGKTYKIKVVGVNSAVVNAKFENKAFAFVTTLPKVLETVFPGVSTSGDVYRSNNISDEKQKNTTEFTLTRVYLESLTRYKTLLKLKETSDDLYKVTKTTPNVTKAKESLAQLYEAFGITGEDGVAKHKIDRLKEKIHLSMEYIVSAEDLFKAKMNEENIKQVIANNYLEQYSSLVSFKEDIKANNYPACLAFVERSLTAVDYVESKPFKASKDVVEVYPVLIDSYSKDTLYKAPLPFYTRGNFSFDFSTGFFLNNLMEKTYYLEKRDSLTANVKEEQHGRYDISVGALAHFSYKTTNWLRLGISTGAALSPFDGKVRYLLGGGFLLGRQKQIGLNAGLAFARLKILSAAVKSDQQGSYVPLSVTATPTYDKIQRGFFVSLTYNLISTKK